MAFNFAAGPATLPPEVIQQARQGLVDWEGCGQSVLELPFTGPEYRAIADRAQDSLRRLLAVPQHYHILFLQGGAYAHSALLAMNLLGPHRRADYVMTGHWSARAITEARRYGAMSVAASAADNGFTRIPEPATWRLDPQAAYCHITTNETANGLQFHRVPDTGETPLVADVTSDFLTEPMALERFGLIYASAQKNVGPSGLTVVLIRDDLLDRALDTTPAAFNYTRQARSASRVNTPPVFAVYIAGLMFEWLLDRGGLAAAGKRNRRKSGQLYEYIDSSDFYRCPVQVPDRSRVNVCFHLPDTALETAFVTEAREAGLLNLNGHAASGGVRASLYNAMPLAGVDALVAFMQRFARTVRAPSIRPPECSRGTAPSLGGERIGVPGRRGGGHAG